jgi:pimeloyl-ACP methyl ester carboxylesterase
LPDRREVSFASGGELCSAWYLRAEGDDLTGPGGAPCVVMAHGLAGTRDSGLLPYAQAFAAAGMHVVLFDYRCFGHSSGEPRQLASPPRHCEDYRAAVRFARQLEGVDLTRIVLWGTSWSGGHVVYVAADDHAVAAAICQTPDLDGIRTLREIARYAGWGQLARVTVEGLKDKLGALRGRSPHMIPVVAPPGQIGAMTSEEAEPGYKAIAGPSWRNELAARAVLEEGRNRSITVIDKVRCPILVQIADRDSVAPPPQARAAAWRAKGRVEVHEYPCAHFDIYVGEWRDRAISDQLHFLRRHLAPVGAEQAAEKA